MRPSDTSLSLLERVNAGERIARTQFAERYAPAVRAFFEARWRARRCRGDLDDAVQEVFLDLFREDGALTRLRRTRPGGLRAYLIGVCANVARRAEVQGAREAARATAASGVQSLVSADSTPSRVFDREWARAVLRCALARQRERAEVGSTAARARLALLEAHYAERESVAAIARRRGVPSQRLYKQLVRARAEFVACLRAVLAEDNGGCSVTKAELEQLLELIARD